MTNDQPSRRPPAKSSGGGAPMGSTISIVIAVVAVVVGFIILRNINDTGDAGSPSLPDVTLPDTDDSSGSTAAPTTASTATTAPPTPTLDTTAKVIVANAAGVKGAAANATMGLQQMGFIMAEPTNGFGPEKIIPTTKVYYVPGSEGTAASVAAAFSTPTAPITPVVMPALIPVEGATIGDALVLVMVGTDLANKPLPALAASTTDTATSVGATSTSGP